jgi:acetyl-CoA C-acetyltransferase
MHEYGTTSEQLAWVKVAASHSRAAQPARDAAQKVVTVEEVVGSPMVADPLHRLDCCVVSDGGGALVVTRPEIARSLARPVVTLRGAGESVRGREGGYADLTTSATRESGAAAFAEAGGDAGGHPLRVDLRLLHDHGRRSDRGSRVLREGRGGDGSSRTGTSSRASGGLPGTRMAGGLCNNHPRTAGE